MPNQKGKDHESKDQESMEEALIRELRFGGIDRENLKELVGIVAGIQKGGLKRIKVFPRGIPPVVDGVQVSGILDLGEVSRFFGEILLNTPRLVGIVVFPYGIPRPEIFRVNMDLGTSLVQSNPMPGINRF